MISKKYKLFLLIISLFFLSACKHYIAVQHDAFSDKALIPSGFTLDSRFIIETPETNNQILTNEITDKIRVLLENKGYEIVDDIRLAEYKINFDIKIDKETKTENVMTVVPEQTISYVEDKQIVQTKNKTFFVPKETVYYKKILTIKVYNMQNQIAWHSTSEIYDQSNDLRKSLNYIIVIAFKLFGQDTKQNILLKLDKEDMDVKTLNSLN